jgi:Uma2 family endonuclease
MTQALQKLFTFDEFLAFIEIQPENIRYELYDGDIIEMPLPTGKQCLSYSYSSLNTKRIELYVGFLSMPT